MNILKTTLTGGFSFMLDDITTIQNNVKDLTSAIAESLSGDSSPFILYGCAISVTNSGGIAPTLVVTKGALWYINEIYLVDAYTLTLPDYTTLATVLSTFYWDLSVTTDSTRVFYDTSVKDVRDIRKAIFTDNPLSWISVQNLLSYKDILKNNSNLDILNKDYQNPATFTLLYNSGSVYARSYTLSKGEHILRLTTPSGSNCQLAVINPPADVFDGYELMIEIKSHATASRGFGIQSLKSINIVPNIDLNETKPIWDDAGTLKYNGLLINYFVSFNVSHSNIYTVAGGEYDIATYAGGRFKILLRWNAKTNHWQEVARIKTIS